MNNYNLILHFLIIFNVFKLIYEVHFILLQLLKVLSKAFMNYVKVNVYINVVKLINLYEKIKILMFVYEIFVDDNINLINLTFMIINF